MPHSRKKGGVRKDKKVARMRQDLEERKLNAGPERPSTDQFDVIDYKPGSRGDNNRRPPRSRP